MLLLLGGGFFFLLKLETIVKTLN